MRDGTGKLIQNGNEGERALIERIRRRAARSSSGLILGIGDDCALLRPKRGEELAVTTDLSIEGRHFNLAWHPSRAVGHRALARGLSDLAAMGARPVAAFLSLGLPRELTRAQGRRPAWVDGFLNGFFALAEACKSPLAGGDLAEAPVALADIVLLGAVPRGKALLRSGALPGDLLCVTGSLGGAAAGLEILLKLGTASGRITRHAIDDTDLAPHLWPQPRLAQGLWLRRRRLATAAIDLSDGLSTDLHHLCAESGVGAEVDADLLPIHARASLGQALNGGEDYELLFTARPNAAIPRAIAGIPVTRIGKIVTRRSGRPRVTMVNSSGRRPLQAGGWQHFS